ncbi:MAG: hypothetical protein AB7D03_12545 [Thiomicrospira sp.]
MKIRKGSSEDFHWIVKLLKEGAKNGHFLPVMQSQAEGFLNSVIENGGVNMIKIRTHVQSPVFVPMTLSVAEIDGFPASFLICCIENKEIEVHLAGTKMDFKRQGCFTYLVEDVVSKNLNSKIYARCYKKSSFAIDAFKKLNFEVTNAEEPIELVLAKINAKKQIKGTRKTGLWSTIAARFT